MDAALDALASKHPDATHVDLFFAPCAPPVLGWAPSAVRGLLELGFPGASRPAIERFTAYRVGDATMTRSPSADDAARVVRVATLSETETETKNGLVRTLRVRPLSAHQFPSVRTFDDVSRVTRARWTLHNRVRLHVDFESGEGEGEGEVATVYIRYIHAENVDMGAVRAAIERARSALLKNLALMNK